MEPGKANCDRGAGTTFGQHRAHGPKASTRVVDSNAWQHAYELIATDASDHVVGAQAGSQGLGHGDEQSVPSSVTSGVIRFFEPVYIDISGYKLSVDALGAIDLAPDCSQPGAAAAYSC